MGIRELEIIDIGIEDGDVRRTDRRGRYRQDIVRTEEEWQEEEWQAEEWQEEEFLVPAEEEWEEEAEDWEDDEWYGEEWEDGEPADKYSSAGYREKGRLEEYPGIRNRESERTASRRQREEQQEAERRRKEREERRRREEYLAAKRQKKERREARKLDEKEEKRRRKRRKRRARAIRGAITAFSFIMTAGLLAVAAWLAVSVYKGLKEEEKVQPVATMEVEEVPSQDIREWARFYAMELERPELAVDLLTVNEYSRPGEELPEVKSIFVHYTANAGTTAEQNRSYFESLSESHERSASAHFVIGYDGTIVQCIPTKEIAYAVKGRNYDSISIECCYLEEDGEFEEETYRSLIELTAWLLHKYELRPENVLRHYDEGGKNCPKYYVEHEDAWNRFLADLEEYMTSVSEG